MGLKNGYFDGKMVYMVTVRVVVVRVVRVRNTQSSIGHGSPGMGFVSLYKGAPIPSALHRRPLPGTQD